VLVGTGRRAGALPSSKNPDLRLGHREDGVRCRVAHLAERLLITLPIVSQSCW
jgi:hypothetical protein